MSSCIIVIMLEYFMLRMYMLIPRVTIFENYPKEIKLNINMTLLIKQVGKT